MTDNSRERERECSNRERERGYGHNNQQREHAHKNRARKHRHDKRVSECGCDKQKLERGSEVVQLVFALPILVVTFGLIVQMFLWIFGSVQFSQACELVAENVSIDKLNDVGISGDRARTFISQEISSNMFGVASDEIEVSDVSITNKSEKYTNGSSSASAVSDSETTYSLMQQESNGILNFRAKYTCKNIVNILGDHTIDLELSRNRLLGRVTEVREDV